MVEELLPFLTFLSAVTSSLFSVSRPSGSQLHRRSAARRVREQADSTEASRCKRQPYIRARRLQEKAPVPLRQGRASEVLQDLERGVARRELQ